MIGYAVQKEGITGIPEVYVYDSQNRYLFMEVAILVGYSSTTVTIRGAGYNQWDDKDKIYILNEKGHKISEHYSPLPKQEQPRYSPPPRPLTPEEIEAQRRENEEFFRFLGQLFIFPFKLIEWLFKPITKWCDKHGLNQEVFTIGGSNTTKNNTNNEKANNTNVNILTATIGTINFPTPNCFFSPSIFIFSSLL